MRRPGSPKHGIIALALVSALFSTLALEAASDRDALLRRTAVVLARGPGGVPLSPLPLPQLREESLKLGAELEAAGLDSLAGLVFQEAGWASFRMGNPAGAATEFERAAALSRRAGAARDEIAALNSIASVTAAIGQTEKAIRLWQGLRLAQVEQGMIASIARSWANISMAYSMQGRPAEALEATDSASSYFAVSKAPDGPSGVAIMRSQVYLSLQRPLEAEQWADSALRSARAVGIAPAVGVALGLSAAAAEAQGKLDQAIARRNEGISFQEQIGDRYTQATLRLARARLFTRAARYAESRAELATLLPVAMQSKDPTFVHQLRTLDAIDQLELGETREAQAALERTIAEFEGVRSAHQSPLARAGVLHQGSEAYAALARTYRAAGRTTDALLAIERGRAPELGVRLGAMPANAPAFADTLRALLGDARAAMLIWSETDLQPAVAVLVTRDSIRAAELPRESPGPAARIALERMAAGAPDPECREAIDRVAKLLLPDWIGGLPDEIEILYLVPPARLSGFPLEVLPLSGSDRLLGERFATAYLPSAAALGALSRRAGGAGGMVVLADPAPSSAPDSGIVMASAAYRALRETPLPAARSEAGRIGVRGAVVATGTEASEAELQRALEANPSVLHFATHALITTLRPEESAIVLAGGDGRLTAREIESLKGTMDLVTLSGCRTAGGHVLQGEGTFGLPRAFLLAGSRSVVASLWDVEDRAAERFMTRFYRELRAGATRARAMQAARAQMAAAGAPLRDRAAFVLVGAGHDPVAAMVGQSLRSAGFPAWGWAGVILLGLAALVGWTVRSRRRGRSAPLAQ